MAVTETRNLPAQFIEDLGKDYAKQLTATTAIPIDTSKFAPQVAAQDALQTQAATLAGSGVGSFQPFIQAATTSNCRQQMVRCNFRWYSWFNRSTYSSTNSSIYITISTTSY